MKNAIKKISSFATAFALLGAGTASTEIITPLSGNTNVAFAAVTTNINNFTDVRGAKYEKAIRYVYDKGIMIGISDTQFGTNSSLTREQFAQLIYNYENKPSVQGYTIPFTDVKKNTWYHDAVVWAYHKGVVKGYSNSTYGVGDKITREQVVQMLYNYTMSGCKKTGNLKKDITPDASKGCTKMDSWAKQAMDWAMTNRIISRNGPTFNDPKGYASRGECAQMIKNLLEFKWNNQDFASELKYIAQNYNTKYVWSKWGQPTVINGSVYYQFDCSGLIKAVLWGWSGNKGKNNGGAKYASNGVPDNDADTIIGRCSDVSNNFNDIEVGEAVWMKGHIGVYIGNGLAVESTPSFKGGVQITACNCNKNGYDRRDWTKHGKLPFIDYIK